MWDSMRLFLQKLASAKILKVLTQVKHGHSQFKVLFLSTFLEKFRSADFLQFFFRVLQAAHSSNSWRVSQLIPQHYLTKRAKKAARRCVCVWERSRVFVSKCSQTLRVWIGITSLSAQAAFSFLSQFMNKYTCAEICVRESRECVACAYNE